MANPDPNAGTVHLAVERREKDAGGAPSNKAAAPKSDKAELPSLSGMTKAELEKQARKEGVDLSDAANNDERRALIEKVRK